MNTTRHRLYRDPWWLHEGDPNDESFLECHDRPCIGRWNLYFSKELVDVARCRQLCSNCPVFEDCVRWTLAHFDLIEFGTVAGMSEQQRRRIDEGTERFKDWRRHWSRHRYVEIIARAHTKRNAVRRIYKRRLEIEGVKS